MTDLLTKDVEYRFDGLTMNGYYAIADHGKAPRPGVLIVPDAFGLDTHCFHVADRLAENGYAAFALDLWGGRRLFTGPDEVMGHVTALQDDREMWMGRVESARQALVSQGSIDAGNIAAIGYCLGGSTVLEFARFGNDIKGAVSFHGGLDFVGTEWDNTRVKARLLICTGVEDPLVPWESLTAFQENLRRGGVNWELDIYSGAKHSFTRPDAARQSSPDRSAYDPQADRRSWRAMMEFLREVFGE